MRNRLPHPLLLRRLLAAAGIGLVVGFAFIAFFTSALHDPKPNAAAHRRRRRAARRWRRSPAS